MSLTTGRGPLGPDPAGRFNVAMPADVVYAEPLRRRIRAVVGERTVVDTEQALLLHRPGKPPTYALPAADVDGVEGHEEADAPGYLTVPWDAVDAWYEEDELVVGHPRNPYHRVDCLRTRRRLRVEIGELTLVDTHQTVGVYETSLEPRLYVRPDLVLMDHLAPSTTKTYCPYKGTASYWNAVDSDIVVEDAAWSYEDPLPECLAIRGLLSFYAHKVKVTCDLPT